MLLEKKDYLFFSCFEKINLRQDLDYQKEADRDTREDEQEEKDLKNQ